MQNIVVTLEMNWLFLKRLNTELPYDPASPLLVYIQ